MEEKINWVVFEVKGGGEDRIKPEKGKQYEFGFSSIRQDELEVVDKEKTAEGRIEIKKRIPVIVLEVDYLNGKRTKREFMVTSKKLIATIKTYFERDLLFTRVFQYSTDGEGYQTTHQLIALQEKPREAKNDVGATL